MLTPDEQKAVSDPEIQRRMRLLLQITEVDEEDLLHQEVAAALWRTRFQTVGDSIVAVRFVFNHHLRAAGAEFARARSRFEHERDVLRFRLMNGPERYSASKADAAAGADDALYGLLLAYRLAEQQERALRKFLDTLDAQTETFRTTRADQRGVDRFEAQSGDHA